MESKPISENSVKNEKEKKQDGIITFKPTVPKIRQKLLKWNAWGYKDSGFEGSFLDGTVKFVGGRYISPHPIPLPGIDEYFYEDLGRDYKVTFLKSVPEPTLEDEFPQSLISLECELLKKLDKLNITYSLKGMDRLVRSRGNTIAEIYNIRKGRWGRIPDIVIWPECHSHVEQVIQLAMEVNYVIIPFGGGTSVSEGLKCPSHESRPIISLDTSQMHRILSIDEDNFTVCAEAGITGQDLERQLKARGFTCGHEPDSYEFSTLGGWVATRASGMKKNTYGNIEDIVLHVKFVSPSGVIEKYSNIAPRISSGPDIHHLILGSEGTLGVVTEVTIKIRPVPQTTRYGAILFPDFFRGCQFMREIAKKRLQPSSIRLADHRHFQAGKAIRPPPTYFETLKEAIGFQYLEKWKGFHMKEICAATLLFEGDEVEVSIHESKIYNIAVKYGGFPIGAEHGKRGYNITYIVAYIQNFLVDHGFYAESFETAVAWDKAYALTENVKERVLKAGKERGFKGTAISCRVTQTYDSGCCIYFYMGITGDGLDDPIKAFMELEEVARDEILANSGSLSHHHGIGKIRRQWIPQTLSPPAIDILKVVKKSIDPQNIFANCNIFEEDDKDSENGL